MELINVTNAIFEPRSTNLDEEMRITISQMSRKMLQSAEEKYNATM